MYRVNQIVEYNGMYGRVMCHDALKHNVHVLFRLNNYTWKITACDDFHCTPAQVFLWTMESAFRIRRPRLNGTPQFLPIEVMDLEVDDHVLEI